MKKIIIGFFLNLAILSAFPQSPNYLKYALPLKQGNSKSIDSSGKLQSSVVGNQALTSIIDGNDIHIFPSSNPQSEVNISINRTHPRNLLVRVW